VPKPTWHAPWKLKAVLAGHLGWVRCVAFEPGNQWFVTGAADRTIKVDTRRNTTAVPKLSVF
jgi:pleiotropic regulator 1